MATYNYNLKHAVSSTTRFYWRSWYAQSYTKFCQSSITYFRLLSLQPSCSPSSSSRFAPCNGQSASSRPDLEWPYGGIIILTILLQHSHRISSRNGLGSFVYSGLLVDTAAILYYFTTFPFISTIAHLCGVAIGVVFAALFSAWHRHEHGNRYAVADDDDLDHWRWADD